MSQLQEKPSGSNWKIFQISTSKHEASDYFSCLHSIHLWSSETNLSPIDLRSLSECPSRGEHSIPRCPDLPDCLEVFVRVQGGAVAVAERRESVAASRCKVEAPRHEDKEKE